MSLAGPYMIQSGRPVPISAERYATMTGRRPAQPVATLTPEEVAAKAAAFDAKATAAARAERRDRQLQRVARMGGPDAAAAKRVLAEDSAAADRKAEADTLAALPKSIEEAGGDARAYMKADMRRRAAAREGVTASTPGRASMAAELRKMGLEPVR